jgi:hypothetical protein
MDLTGFLVDHMGHFSAYDIPGVLFLLLMAALLGWVMGYAGGERGASLRQLALWAATAALATAFMRMQLPVALALLGVLLLVRPSMPEAPRGRLLLFGALVLGLGCGSGAALIMALAAIPYVLLVRWALAPEAPGTTDA